VVRAPLAAKCHLAGTAARSEFHYRLSVKDKGRMVLAAGLRRECGFAAGADLTARPPGPGQFIVEMAEAVLDRIWRGAPADGPGGAVADVAAWRTRSDSERMSALSAGVRDEDDTTSDPGAELLHRLGCDRELDPDFVGVSPGSVNRRGDDRGDDE